MTDSSATGRCDVAFVEPRTELRADLAARYPVTAAFESFEAALEHPHGLLAQLLLPGAVGLAGVGQQLGEQAIYAGKAALKALA